MNIHTLSNGATVISTSMHGFKFSDDTECSGNPEIAKMFTLERVTANKTTIKGMAVNETRMVINEEQKVYLGELCQSYDIVIVPFPVLVSLREMGIRDNFPNAVAFNATKETQRLPPQDKIVDIQNWSY